MQGVCVDGGGKDSSIYEQTRVQNAGFSAPTPIQAQSWPIALQSKDIVAIAKTGSGKTLGYLLPAFIHLKRTNNNSKMCPTVLVLSPTRELATQIQDEAVKFSKTSRISCTSSFLLGLMHDVGHGPFSHLFEREFLPQVMSGSDWSHEQMSVNMVDHIVEEHRIDIDPQMLKRVKEMILASSEFALPRSSSEKSFLYDIVANGRNGIDVDKFDYIARDCRACGVGCNFEFQRLLETMRVLDDKICYRAKDYLTIHKLFATRADLYRTVYTHPKVKAIELMVVDALVQANDYLQISSSIQDPGEYWKLDDSIIKTIEISHASELKEARELILRIRRRNLYQFCNEYAVPRDIMDNFKKVTPKDIVCSQKNGGVMLKEEDVAVCNTKIDLTRGKDNPLESSIHFFKI
uniref:Deoxynucleoside triphosphate triphosphohydrolase SAMHD1 homolog n=2 Tax=Cicer arietinum TaxID=3827 RepID=A0A3Q7YCP6_CICAR|nr:deoxynucleoside triphosphate triphosphohydrolase SAMHD1 homolog [Cicer arietinum]